MTRMNVHNLARLTILVFTMGILSSACVNDNEPCNVLFLGIDDLRPEIHSYGFTQMKTPNIDRIAEMGIQFNRAYVQQAVCAASRASFLTGCRPVTTGVNYPYSKWFNETFRNEHQTIPVWFAEQGYYTRTLGKIHHGDHDEGLTEEHFFPKAPLFPDNPEYRWAGTRGEWRSEVKPWSHPDLPDTSFMDGQITRACIETIRRAVRSDKPFFIAPGYLKPHLPFVCPEEYYDLYDREDIRLSEHPELDESQHQITAMKYGAHNWYDYAENDIPEEDAYELKHHYYACVSFIDAQVGKLLDELERLDILDNTIIMLWSDHGYHLGDHGIWTKQTNYELGTRVPLIIYDPRNKNRGVQTNALVEYVDLYPTLLEMCHMEIPEWIEGTSMVPVLQEPGIKWKNAAFSQFPRDGGEIEGYSVRTRDFRYTEWRDEMAGGAVFHRELYDHRRDSIETVNLAEHPDYAGVLSDHKEILSRGWKEALPEGVTNLSDNPPGYDWKKQQFLKKND